jgi:hypothetical protein
MSRCIVIFDAEEALHQKEQRKTDIVERIEALSPEDQIAIIRACVADFEDALTEIKRREAAGEDLSDLRKRTESAIADARRIIGPENCLN